MRKKEQVQGDSFLDKLVGQINEQDYDIKRMKRLLMADNNNNKDDAPEEAKIPFRMHKFKEEAHKNQKDMAQHNHEFMKMTSQITRSVLDPNRFAIPLNKEGKKKHQQDEQMVNWDNQLKPVITLKLKTEMSSSVLTEKFEMKPIYQIVPFKRNSIELEPNIYRDPAFQFFFFKTSLQKENDMVTSLTKQLDDGLADLKEEVLRITCYMTFFDLIHMIKHQGNSIDPPTKTIYPPQVLEIAKATQQYGQSKDDQDYNKSELNVDSIEILERIFECDDKELSKPFQCIYFKDLEEYENFKSLREIEFKALNIYTENISINTDVRSIISSEKIYLINIIEEVKLLVRLAKENKEDYLYDKIHKNMILKIGEYLRLICGYTTSTLFIRYNVSEPYERIFEFLKKSILYNKPYRVLDEAVIQKYQVLELWYHLPENLHGYNREQIHDTLYQLIEATIQFEKKIQQMRQYERLKVCYPTRKYNIDQK